VQPIDEGPDVRAVGGEGTRGTDIESGALGTGEGSPLADIHFELDSAALTEEARATLEKHALWLQGRRDVNVTIEGHCDERGTVDYNLALGEQRARATRDYLVSLGVAADRLRVVSFGKERPVDAGHDEAAWARNRRAHFAVSR
jgi:peptidoglycan-associated lipoprotein